MSLLELNSSANSDVVHQQTALAQFFQSTYGSLVAGIQ